MGVERHGVENAYAYASRCFRFRHRSIRGDASRRCECSDRGHHLQRQSAPGAEHRLSGNHHIAGQYSGRDRRLRAGLVQGRLRWSRRLDVGRFSARPVEPAGDRAAGADYRAGSASSSAPADLSSAGGAPADRASAAPSPAGNPSAASNAAGNSSATPAASSSAGRWPSSRWTSSRRSRCRTEAARNPSAAAAPSARRRSSSSRWRRRTSAAGHAGLRIRHCALMIWLKRARIKCRWRSAP